jgi:tetratricopeptide (TPR) repeat protein
MLRLRRVLSQGVTATILALAVIEYPACAQTFFDSNLENQSQGQQVAQGIAKQQLEKRIALVIGNSAYQEARLNNPVNDANDMAAALRELGFEVILLQDASQRQMEEAVDRLNEKLRPGGTGLFYYSGHGMQVKGENYLIPIDARIRREQDVLYETLPVGKVIGAMEDAGNEINIIILDACRDNPFSRSWRSGTRGLAEINAVRGMLIAYATAPGQLAEDGKGRNGTYTSYLLKHIKTANLDAGIMFRRVREDVDKETHSFQIPWESSSIIGDFSFNPQPEQMAANTATATNIKPPEGKPPSNVPSDFSGDSPKNAQTYISEAFLYALGRKYDQALANYSQALEIDPQSAYAYAGRAKTYNDLGKYEQAIADFNRAIEIDPKVADSYNNRGYAYHNVGKYQQAIADFNQALALEPNYIYAYNNRGNTYNQLGQYEQAIADFNRAIKIDPQDASAYNNRGNAYNNWGKYQQAIADYNKAISLSPQFAEAYNNRGYAYSKLGKYEQAIADFTQAIAINPNYAYAYNNRASAYYKLGNSQQASFDRDRAVQIDPQIANLEFPQ